MPTKNSNRLSILIASYLEPECVQMIQELDKRIIVNYHPDLLRKPRYSADHDGHPITRTKKQEEQWIQLLKQADILFDFDQTHLHDLPEINPDIKWIQATSSGIGQLIDDLNYDTRLPNTIFTTASGIHAQPLAEFCLLSMLMHSRKLTCMMKRQSQKHWERYAGNDLLEKTVLILGMGKIGKRIAEIAHTLGMKVIGITRTKSHRGNIQIDDIVIDTSKHLYKYLNKTDYLILSVPHTPQTDKLIGETELNMLPKGAILINIARGNVVDEQALIKSLYKGQLDGAYLDVFEKEPLPKESPLWSMPNVLISPHSASTSIRENYLITELFCDNLKLYLKNQPLINVFNTKRLY